MKLTGSFVASFIFLVHNTNFGYGFLPKYNTFFQSVSRVKNFDDQFAFRVSKKSQREVSIDIGELATTTLEQLGTVEGEIDRFKIMIMSLFRLDKHIALKHQDKMFEADNKLHYYKGKASVLGQRYALEELFFKVIDVTKENVSTLKHALRYSSIMKSNGADMCVEQIISVDKPQMEHLNKFVSIPEVAAVIQPLIGYSVQIPLFKGRLVNGVLTEPENDAEIYDTICVAQDDKHADFFADLARLLHKPFEVYDPARAYAGQSALRRENGLHIHSGEPILPK